MILKIQFKNISLAVVLILTISFLTVNCNEDHSNAIAIEEGPKALMTALRANERNLKGEWVQVWGEYTFILPV